MTTPRKDKGISTKDYFALPIEDRRFFTGVRLGRHYVQGVVIIPPESERKVQAPMIDVWQVCAYVGMKHEYHGIYHDRERALTEAIRVKREAHPNDQVRLQHKAAIEINPGQFHLVHMSPIRWKDQQHAARHEEEDRNRQDSVRET